MPREITRLDKLEAERKFQEELRLKFNSTAFTKNSLETTVQLLTILTSILKEQL